MPIEVKDLFGPGVSILAVVLAYLKLRSASDKEKGEVAERLKNLSEKVTSLQDIDMLTKGDCTNCVERVRMNSVEQCVAKLERIVSKNEEKTNEFIKNLSAFMGGVKQFMKLHSETLTYYREQKLASRVETLEKSVSKE
jgi:hypothetical protein